MNKKYTAVGSSNNKSSKNQQEETLSTEIDGEQSFDSTSSNNKKPTYNRKGPVTTDMLRQMSKHFHYNVPPNPFYREKIPYKTIIIVSS